MQMCTKTAVVHEDFERRLHTGTFRVHCGGAEVSVQHRLLKQDQTGSRVASGQTLGSAVMKSLRKRQPAYLPVSQNCVELPQWPLTKSQHFLSCRSVAEQVLQVNQCQVWFGFLCHLDTHLSTCVCLVLVERNFTKHNEALNLIFHPDFSKKIFGDALTDRLARLSEPLGDEFEDFPGLAPAAHAAQQLAVLRRHGSGVQPPQSGQNATAGDRRAGRGRQVRRLTKRQSKIKKGNRRHPG